MSDGYGLHTPAWHEDCMHGHNIELTYTWLTSHITPGHAHMGQIEKKGASFKSFSIAIKSSTFI